MLAQGTGFYALVFPHSYFRAMLENRIWSKYVAFKNDERAIQLANSFKGQYDDRLLEIIEQDGGFAEFDIFLKEKSG